MPRNIFFEPTIGLAVHEATKNLPGGQQAELQVCAPPPPPGAWARQALPLSGVVSLQPETNSRPPSLRSALQTLAERRSIRRYGAAPFTRAQLAHFLACAYPPEVTQPDYRPPARPHARLGRWNGHVTLCRSIVLALCVEGLSPGAYLYDEYEQNLYVVRQENPLPLIKSVVFQAEFTLAPVICVQVGSLADCLERYGERGYRYLLFENGVMIQRYYLAASFLDLNGCVSGSLTQRDFDRWLGLDGFHAGVMNMFVVGNRLTEEESDE